MKEQGRRLLRKGVMWIALFATWTTLIQIVDVRCVGETGTKVGFAWLNSRVHQWIGVHMQFYTITDWMGLIPVLLCLLFGGIGLVQMIQRKSLRRVDLDLILLGIYYVIVALGYIIFEMVPINYRPVLLDGRMETSYPSSTTLLVLSVMPTVSFQVSRRLEQTAARKIIHVLTTAFSVFMVIGRLISGVHWFTDIAGAVFLSRGLFCMYRAVVVFYCKTEE